eukprot:scaffold3281_cov156-Amphora_coffeaeformis.AAC.2
MGRKVLSTIPRLVSTTTHSSSITSNIPRLGLGCFLKSSSSSLSSVSLSLPTERQSESLSQQ